MVVWSPRPAKLATPPLTRGKIYIMCAVHVSQLSFELMKQCAIFSVLVTGVTLPMEKRPVCYQQAQEETISHTEQCVIVHGTIFHVKVT